MRLGLCAPYELIDRVAEAGYDYLEWWVTAAVALDAQAFAAACRHLAAARIRCEACCIFFPKEMRLTGPHPDTAAITRHLATAAERLAALGVGIAVVGSGAARMVPDGFDRRRGLEQFADLLRRIGDALAPHGITAVIEPLNRQETNLINTVAEALAWSRHLAHPAVRVMADFFHLARDDEGYGGVWAAGADLRHAHCANPQGRTHPARPDEADYAGFLAACRAVGYDDRLSVEVFSRDYAADLPQAAQAAAMLRRLL